MTFGGVRLIDGVSDAEVARMEGHAAPVTSACFDRDGERLVTASWDTTGAGVERRRGDGGPRGGTGAEGFEAREEVALNRGRRPHRRSASERHQSRRPWAVAMSTAPTSIAAPTHATYPRPSARITAPPTTVADTVSPAYTRRPKRS